METHPIHLTPKREELAERRRKVAVLRLQHWTENEIAAELGVSQPTISRDLAVIRDEWLERRMTAYDQWVAEELAKLEVLERTLLPEAIAAGGSAVDRVLSVMDRRARLLGLDKPQLHEHTIVTEDALDAEIRRLEERLARHDEPLELPVGDA